MAAGLGLLRLPPQAFWAMTPRELERALSVLAPRRAQPPARNILDALMKTYPDRKETNDG